ncbi:hypothetical protein ACF1GY_21845 [Streptomyces sp. NPDC014684]|uniref:hypothetical protein n=1 Tax=Streptomyces sp. NPDC014684 TaxID=3364880 RepID=UPI003701918C
MARVPWAALSGDEVEAVVANLIYQEFSRAHRIRPAQGDYGIDVLVPSASRAGYFDVYQIKKFATNLTDSQKGQIKKSFRRVLLGLVRKDIPLDDWYLVMPLDPTLDNLLEWFEAMPQEVISEMFSDAKLELTDAEKEKISGWKNTEGRNIDWKGLLFCEALTSKYWYVPDYYLNDGSERIRSATTEVARLLRRDMTLPEVDEDAATSILEPAEVVGHLRRLQGVLDGDPHFRYGVSLDPSAPDVTQDEGLVAATQQIYPDGACLTFRIYSRVAESLNERPIPIELTFSFEESVPESFEEWRKYGKPLSGQAGFRADMPGGLGGEYESGSIYIGPVADDTVVHRYRIVTPEGDVVAEDRFISASSSGLDGSGRWISGAGSNGLLHAEALLDVSNRNLKVTFSLGDVQGKAAIKALPAVRFAAGLTHPNRLQVAGEYGPFSDLLELTGDALVPAPLLAYVKALAFLQDFTPIPISLPKFEQLTAADVRSAVTAASLLSGKTVVGNWSRLKVSQPNEEFAFESGAQYQILVIKPLVVSVERQRIVFGAMGTQMLSAKFSREENGVLYAFPDLNDSLHQSYLPGEPAPEGEFFPVRFRPFPD